MPEKKDHPQSYSLYQIVARLFGHTDDEGLNSENALPCLEFIVEQVKRGDGPQAYFKGQRVSPTEKEKRETIENRSGSVSEGYMGFHLYRNPQQKQRPDEQEQAKVLKINRDDWRSYLEKLREEIKDAENRPALDSWEKVFVRTGYHSQEIVDQIKIHIMELGKAEKQHYLSKVEKEMATIKNGENDYIGNAKVVHEQYEQNPFWEDGKTTGRAALNTPKGKYEIYKQKYQNVSKGKGRRQDITPAELKECLQASSLDKHPADCTLRRWFSEATGIKGKPGAPRKQGK